MQKIKLKYLILLILMLCLSIGIILIFKDMTYDNQYSFEKQQFALNNGTEPQYWCHHGFITATDNTRIDFYKCENYIFTAGTTYP